jgi:thymidylate synthase ThyX
MNDQLKEIIDSMRQDGITISVENIRQLRLIMETEPDQYHGYNPRFCIVREGRGIITNLLYAPEQGPLYRAIFQAVTATWGPTVIKDVDWDIMKWIVENQVLNHATLSQCLEIPTFVFAVEGAPRSAMDQHFRPRIGAGFCAQGVRDNDARMRDVVLPREIYDDAHHQNEARIALEKAFNAYSMLVDEGVSYQGARAIMPMGMVNNWIGIYNWLSLANMMGKRLALCEQPETVEVAWSMWRDVYGWNPVWAFRLLPTCVRVGHCVYKRNYTDGQLFSDLHNPTHCPIFKLLEPDYAEESKSTFKHIQPLAIESWGGILKDVIIDVVKLRNEGYNWFKTFRKLKQSDDYQEFLESL